MILHLDVENVLYLNYFKEVEMGGDLLLGDTVDLEPKKTHFVNLNGIFDTMETSIKERIIPKIEKKLERTSREAIGDFRYNGDIGQFLNIDKTSTKYYNSYGMYIEKSLEVFLFLIGSL
jgi:hypothetical protein